MQKMTKRFASAPNSLRQIDKINTRAQLSKNPAEGFTPTPNSRTQTNKEKLETGAKVRKNLVRGFTLVELLLVIGIIATLAVVVFVALDPAKRFQDSRDARRTSDVETILSAVHQYVIDNKGSFPASLNVDEERMLGTYGASCDYYNGGCNVEVGACLNLSEDLSSDHPFSLVRICYGFDNFCKIEYNGMLTK